MSCCFIASRESAGEASFTPVCRVHSAHAQDINGVRWSPTDSTALVSCSDDGGIKFWRFTAPPL